VAFTIRKVEYYYANVRDEVGAAYGVLSRLSERGVNLLAFTAVPSGPSLAQFTLFPEDPGKLVAESRNAGLALDGPYHAVLVQGDDELGALANVHERLARANVDVFASTGVTDGRGAFGYVVYVREDQFEQAASALKL
jgi:predicted amino acid-binding ACT domain protein